MVRPCASRRRNSSQVAQSGTRLLLAISTRGAHSWVRNTATGLPDCTSRVSSSASAPRLATKAFNASPPPRPPVDDEAPGPLGHLRVDVVHQHPEGGLLRPALATELRAPGRPHDA